MAYRSFGRFRQASTHLDTPPFSQSHHPVSAIAHVPLDIVLHTPGGLVLAALQIAGAIRGHKAKVTVFVPHFAMSGGTLISLAADEIVMSRYAVLGPIDPQLGQFPAVSLIKGTEQKPVAEIDDQTLILADVGR